MSESSLHRLDPAILARARELRHPQTPPEVMLWHRLRDRQLGGFKFRRQHLIGRFVVDFYCAACMLVVEVDGDSHVVQEEYDRARTQWLGEQGCHMLRVTNRDVCGNMEGVLTAILGECERLASAGPDASSHDPLPVGERGAREADAPSP